MTRLNLIATFLSVGAGLALSQAADAHAKGKPKAPLADLKLVEGDERGNEIKSAKAEMMVAKTEKQAIAQAQRLLKKHKGTELEPEIHFRLAELYMRKSKTDRFFELHRESETVVRLAPRLTKTASSRASVQQAVGTYQLIQSRFPKFGQMDLVIFNHAFARQILGQTAEAERLYGQLIRQFPKSSLLPDTHLAVGEILFDRAKFQAALEQFNAIRKFPKARVYPYGLYKAAWAHYNLRDAAKGLKTLEEVVAYGRNIAAKNPGNSLLDLRKEALNDMTIFFEDVHPAKKAYAYFLEQAGKDEVAPILLRMGSLYERHSRFAEQIVVLEQFIEEMPNSELMPKVYTDLVNALDQSRKKESAVARLEQLAGICAKSAQKQDCLAQLNDTSLRLAGRWLKTWKKLPKETSYADVAERAFVIYLATPAQTEEFAASRFAYAELLFARNKFRQSSSEYAAVAQSNLAPKLAHDAAYASVLALEKAVGDKWTAEDETQFFKLARFYVDKHPKGSFRLDIEYKMALLAYEKERYDEAKTGFAKIGREFPTHEKGVKAQDLVLDILNIKKDYKGVLGYAKEAQKLTKDAGRVAKLQKIHEQAYFLDVQVSEEKGDLKTALAGYQNFVKQNPKSDLADKANWNVMQLLYKTGDNWNGAKAAEAYANAYPKSAQATDALLKAAHSYEHMGQLGHAARVLTLLSGRDAKSASRWKELAADFQALDGQTAPARRAYQDLAASGSAANRQRLLVKLEALEKNYGTEKTHASALAKIIDLNIQPQAHLARVEAVERDFKRRKHTEAFNEARRLLGSGMNRNLKARLRLVQAKILEEEFLKSSVKSRADRVATVLAIKTEKLQKAQEALQSAIKYGDPTVSMEAFERLYDCYDHYVKALKEMPTPKGLSKEEEQAFRAEIANLVVPLEEKAVDTLAQAAQFAAKQPTLNGPADRLANQLQEKNHQVAIHVAPQLTLPDLALPVLPGVGQ